MDKKLIGLLIVIIITVVIVSGCTSDDKSFKDNDQVKNDLSHGTGDISAPAKDSSSENKNNHDPQPNEEPEPPAGE